MKKQLFLLPFLFCSLFIFAQTPRMVLYEEFTGENCGPCAATNPGLNVKLNADSALIIPIKWQVPIPSAPTPTWSLYKTNHVEIDWRWMSTGYGYNPAINSAPSSKIDGKEATLFGAASSHPADLTHTVITTAQSYTSPFSISLVRAWNKSSTAVNLTITVQASASFTSVGALVFRTVMVERLIQFASAPGTNGESTFEDVAIKSFPTLQLGTPLSSTWTAGQTQTFTLSCPLPSYTRKKDQVAIVGFIQDDGDRTVKQAVRANKAPVPSLAVSCPLAKVDLTCTNMITPTVAIKNESSTTSLTSATLTPYIDGVAGTPIPWTGNLAPGASINVVLNQINSSSISGSHSFSCDIDLPTTPFNLIVNNTKLNYMAGVNYQNTPVMEGFSNAAFPPASFGIINLDGGPSWSRVNFTGGFNNSMESAKYDFFSNTVVGDKDELYLPPMDLSAAPAPYLSFDVAYAMRNVNSNDQLEVLVSDNCGASWTSVYNNMGPSLVTITNYYTQAYVPGSSNPSSHWRTETVDLSAFNKPNVLVKFVATNDHGNNLYLDNINLAMQIATGIRNNSGFESGIRMFPNPTTGTTELQIGSQKTGKVNVSVINTLGQVLFTKSASVNEGFNSVQLDMSSYPAGVYLVSIDTNRGPIVKKLTVSK